MPNGNSRAELSTFWPWLHRHHSQTRTIANIANILIANILYTRVIEEIDMGGKE